MVLPQNTRISLIITACTLCLMIITVFILYSLLQLIKRFQLQVLRQHKLVIF